MIEDVYVRLRDKLETMGTGYPATENGVEFTFLKKLFTPEDAEFFIAMPDGFQTAASLATQLGQDEAAVTAQLAAMASRGILYKESEPELRYRTIPTVFGLLEFNFHRFEPAMLEDFFQHFAAGFGARMFSTGTPVVRAVPVRASIDAESKMLPFDDAETILKRQEFIAIAPCGCRKLAKMAGAPGCDHTLEACITVGKLGRFMVENGGARQATLEEALAVLKDGDEKGRVIQVMNSQDPEGMCSCCSCCCADLLVLNGGGHDLPGREASTNYYCVRDEQLCTQACTEICTGRCPTHAQAVVDDKVTLNLKFCIGCGLCVTTCPSGALSLQPKAQVAAPPATLFDAWDAQTRALAAQKQAGKA